MEVSAGEDFQQNVIAIAEYDYSAKEDDEIDLRKGQELKNIIQKPGGWWEGTITETGKRGIFPDNFVRVVDNVGSNVVVLREKSTAGPRRCKAIYSYTQVNEDELTLSVGDIIDFLTEVEEGWWKGRLNNKVGVFPSNFVVVLPNPPVDVSQRLNLNEDSNIPKSKTKKGSNIPNKSQNSLDKNAIRNKIIDTTLNKSIDNNRGPELPPRPIKEFCRVEFPYSPQNDDELELIAGQIIAIVDKELPDKGWWRGEVNGKIGVFPDNFVKLLPPSSVTIEKDVESSQSTVKTEETYKIKNKTSTISPPKGFETKSLHEKLSNRTELLTESTTTQGMSLEELSINISASTSNRTNDNSGLKKEGTKKKKDNFDEKKTPPPLPNKKPIITAKTNVASTVLSSSRQKGKSVDQEPILSQDANDSHSRKSNNEIRNNNERTVSFDEIIGLNSEFDKVQRASLLPDMRAGRVKAPKRRPPSVATNLMPENISENSTKENEDNSIEWESEESAQHTEQVKPKNIDWGAQKLPWMDELKASQIKIKLLPFIEPRTTLTNVNNEKNSEIKNSGIPANVNSKVIDAVDNGLLLKENVVQSSPQPSIDQNNISKAEINEQVSAIRTSSEIRDQFKELEQNKSSKIVHSKKNVMQMVSEHSKSLSSYVSMETSVSPENATQEDTIVELGKRVQRLEANVQVQQKLIEDLIRMLQNESNRVELLKNQLDKYAQCVTQV